MLRPLRIAFALILLQGTANVRPAAAQPADDQQRPLTWTRPSGTTLTLFPPGNVYPVYIADPHRPMIGLTEMVYTKVRIEETRSPRVGLSGGGQFGILRIDPAKPGGRSWQVTIAGGLDAVFDSQNKLDAIGWEGDYGASVSTATGGPFAFKLAVQHVSSHVGDEYAERTGRERINYTREEVALGASWRFSPRWRAYGEAAVAYIRRNDEQEPWRVQTGIEYESRPTLWGGRFAWYGAADLSSWEERGWRLDNALQGGILTRTNGRTYRLGLGWTDGRPHRRGVLQIYRAVVHRGHLGRSLGAAATTPNSQFPTSNARSGVPRSGRSKRDRFGTPGAKIGRRPPIRYEFEPRARRRSGRRSAAPSIPSA